MSRHISSRSHQSDFRSRQIYILAALAFFGFFYSISSCASDRFLFNSDCTDALPIQCGETLSGETTLLSEANYTNPDCGLTLPALSGQWFAVEGTGDIVELTTCESLFNSSIAVFSGFCTDLSCVAAGSADPEICAEGFFDNASVSFQTQPGIPYFILVYGSEAGDAGVYSISASCEEPPSVPENNNCDSAILLETNGELNSATNAGATSSIQGFMNCDSGSGEASENDVWFRFLAPETGRIAIETFAGTLQNTKMQILDGCGGEVIACDEDSGPGQMAAVELPCNNYIPGSEYLIQVDGGGGNEGDFSISITIEPCIEIFGCTDPDACNFNPEATVDDESCLIPEAGCTTCDGNELFILDADEDGVCDSEDGCPGDPNKSEPGICGCGEVDIDENSNGVCDSEETPENDTPCNATNLVCGQTITGNSFGASQSATCSNGDSRAGIWYEFAVDALSEVTLGTCFKDTDFNTELSVYSGDCDNLSCFTESGESGLIPNGNSCEGEIASDGTQGTFTAPAGTYYIMVHGGSENATGNFTLSLTCEAISSTAINGVISWNTSCGEREGELEFFNAGTSDLAGAYPITVSENGSFALSVDISGNYDLYLKVDGYLAVVEQDVLLQGNNLDIAFDTPIPGDITGSNVVGLPDFSAFSAAYGINAGSPGFNPLADLNCDGAINLQDFSVFSTNYGANGVEP